jgi:hypothetical protein
MKDGIEHTISPFDFTCGELFDALNDGVAVAVALGKDGKHEGDGGSGDELLIEFHGRAIHCNAM